MSQIETPSIPVRTSVRAGRSLLRSRRGMTLVEIMVAIAIIATVTSIVGYGVIQVFQGSQVDTTLLQMTEVNKKIELYMLKKGVPSSSEGLSAVYGDMKVPTDSWGNDFIYVVPGNNGHPYDIISLGSDGVEGGSGNAADLRWSEAK